MYNARIEMDDGRTLDLGFDNGIIFDISPLSGIDVDISTSQSYNQIGESVADMSTFGLTREIFGVIINDENKNSKNILNTLTAFSSGKIYINDSMEVSDISMYNQGVFNTAKLSKDKVT